MEVRSVGSRRISAESSDGHVSALSMYKVPPTEQLSVSEFEDYAFDRLRCAPPPPPPSKPPLTHSSTARSERTRCPDPSSTIAH